jgi:phage shock protein PspC (stress-responsive transcriptional regulator)
MVFWLARASLIACAILVSARSARDRFVFGVVAGVVVALLTIANLIRPETYFLTIGLAASASIVAFVVAWLRERDLPAARTRSRELLLPFIGCAASSVGGFAITALAHSLSEP